MIRTGWFSRCSVRPDKVHLSFGIEHIDEVMVVFEQALAKV